MGFLPSQPDNLTDMMDVFDAKRKAKDDATKLGTARALEKVDAEHKATLEALDAKQREEMETHKADPVARSAALVRAANRLRKRREERARRA